MEFLKCVANGKFNERTANGKIYKIFLPINRVSIRENEHFTS